MSYLLYARQSLDRARLAYLKTAIGLCKVRVQPSFLLHPAGFPWRRRRAPPRFLPGHAHVHRAEALALRSLGERARAPFHAGRHADPRGPPALERQAAGRGSTVAKAAVIGGGGPRATLAHRLAKLGNQVDPIEAAPGLGGPRGAAEVRGFRLGPLLPLHPPARHEPDPAARRARHEGRAPPDAHQDRPPPAGASTRCAATLTTCASLLSVIDKARLGVTVLHAVRSAKPFELSR